MKRKYWTNECWVVLAFMKDGPVFITDVKGSWLEYDRNKKPYIFVSEYDAKHVSVRLLANGVYGFAICTSESLVKEQIEFFKKGE